MAIGFFLFSFLFSLANNAFLRSLVLRGIDSNGG